MTERPRRRLAAYVRVSSATQANNQTHEGQKEALAAWAERNNAELVFYEDLAVSGTKNVTGPVFVKMLSDLDKLGLSGIVTASFDRLGRDAIELMQLTRDLKARGKELVSIREGDFRLATALSATDQLSRDIISVIADFDRRLTVEKMQNGLARYRAKGGRIGRKPVVVDWNEADKLIKAGASSGLIARVLGINKHTARTKVRQRRAELGVIAPNTPKKNRKEKP